ncbi:zinc finger CCCH domain-containing protein 18-like [Chenopodium quinoa]|uniref:zinc finger CCCH domain-containing protein 18-like n=1 Tax=Chenopodium quinoa TaxID=63459 RepID=UPI000B774177|nr:zinc finger CCCH domain-containing protein 18-like [Chenopodium quinoa]
MAKAMLREIPVEDREAVKGVGTLNLEAILALLVESMLQVYGLRKPINDKNKEVKAAKAMAASDSDKAMFQIAQNEVLTTDILYSQASANVQVKKDLEAAKKKILDLEKAVFDLNEEMTTLKQAEKDAKDLRERVEKLKGRLASRKADLSQQLTEKAEGEKAALVQDMMEDSTTIMKMTRAALFPDADYDKWDRQFAACSDEYNKQIMEEAGGDEDAEGEESDSTAGESKQEEAAGEEGPAQEGVIAEKEPSRSRSEGQDQAAVDAQPPA